GEPQLAAAPRPTARNNVGDSSPFHEFEHHGWQRAAARYGPGFGIITVQAISPLLDAAGAKRGIRVLDVACGPGYAAAAAASRGCVVTGVDFSSEMVSIAQQENPGVEFREGDA